MNVSQITLTIARTVQTKPYENARAEVTLTAELADDEDYNEAAADLLAQAQEALAVSLHAAAQTKLTELQ